MTLSLIIPMYNVEAFIERCLDSVLPQIKDNFDVELILINDGSPDRSTEIAQSLILGYNNARIINQKNGGLSSARNTGVKFSEGEYIWFIDSDDWIEPHSIDFIRGKIYTEGPFDMMSISAKDTNSEEIRNVYTVGKSAREIFSTEYFSPCAPFYIFNRKFLEINNLEFLEGIYHEDSEFTPRALYLAKNLVVSNEMLYNVYINQDSITRVPRIKKSYDILVIARRLNDFRNYVITEDFAKKVIAKRISVDINDAISNVLRFGEKERRKFNKTLANNSYVFNVMAESGVTKYKIESFLFRHIPFIGYINIYKILSLIKQFY